MDVADEQIDATFQAFQGLTVACARCHDHKFDPIPQKDYYALAGIFRSTETCYGTIRIMQSNHPSPLVTLPKGANAPVGLEPLTAERREPGSKSRSRTCSDEVAEGQPGQNAFIHAASSCRPASPCCRASSLSTRPTARRKPLAMGVREGPWPADSRLYIRGELDQPGETVQARLPAGADRQAAVDRAAAAAARTGRLDRLEGQSADGPRHGQPRLAAPVRPRPGGDARQLRRRRPDRRAIRPCSITWPSPSSTTAGR